VVGILFGWFSQENGFEVPAKDDKLNNGANFSKKQQFVEPMPSRKRFPRKYPQWMPVWLRWVFPTLEKGMALVAVADLGLVLFDMSYVPGRDFYLRHLPVLVEIYDPIKGIEPYRDTEKYLDRVNQLEAQLVRTAKRSPQIQELLQQLRQQSAQLPEQVQPNRQYGLLGELANWLQDLQRRFRHWLQGNFLDYQTQPADFNRSLAVFWQVETMEEIGGLPAALAFFDAEIRPQINALQSPEGLEYLRLVDRLKIELAEAWLNTTTSRILLDDLQEMSVEIIDQNPFQVAEKSGTLEKIKNRMREHIYTAEDSAKQSFQIYWSRENLLQPYWPQELVFFNEDIRFLLSTNYFRSINESGNFTDRFLSVIDVWFILIFVGEILGRAVYYNLTHPFTIPKYRWYEYLLLVPVGNWLQWAFSRRWYDLPLLLPFWRWLRVIPVAARLHESRLVDMETLRQQISQDIIANFAGELTEIVVIRVLSQVQEGIAQGNLVQWVFQEEEREYIDLNDIDEVQTISDRLVQITAYQVLPAIQPDLQAFVRHSLDQALAQSNAYKQFKNLPGVGNFPSQMTDRLAGDLTRSICNALQSSLEDDVGSELLEKIVQNFTGTFRSEVQKEKTIQEIQELLYVFIEEVKINYVKRSTQEDFERILEETEQLYRQAQESSEK
jgi:hypothetical protein